MYQSWIRLWPFIRPYKGQILLATFLGFLYAQLQVVLPALVHLLVTSLERLDDKRTDGNTGVLDIVEKQISSQENLSWMSETWNMIQGHWFFSSSDIDKVKFIALCFPVYYLIMGIVRYLHFFWVKFIGEKVISDIRLSLMNKFMDLDVLFLNRQKKGSGGLLSRTLNDTIVLQNGLQYYADLVREPVVGLFLIGFLFYTNWKMTLGCFIFLPIFTGVIRYVSKSLRKFGHQSQESLEEVTKTLKEGLDGVRVIQSFNLQETIKQRFLSQVEDYLDKRRKIILREELGSPINEWFASILVCAFCLFQVQLITTGESDLAGFLAFIFAAGQLDKPIKKTQQAVIRIQQNVVALDRLQEVFDMESMVKEPIHPVPIPEKWETIDFKNVSFGYKDEKVIENINLSIQRGEVVALVGQSGSGKSTLAGLLQRFFDPQQGEVLIGGTNVKDVASHDLRDQIGLVTQDVFLFDDSIENNIAMGNLSADPKGVEVSAQMANATGFINSKAKGFQTKVGERGGKLSGGEKQRVSIARAVFKDPPILILDEATSALDSESEKEVQKGIESLLKGRTALVIAHRLSTIINCDRIIVMKDGKIVEEGTHNDLLAKDNEYAKFYKLQHG